MDKTHRRGQRWDEWGKRERLARVGLRGRRNGAWGEDDSWGATWA